MRYYVKSFSLDSLEISPGKVKNQDILPYRDTEWIVKIPNLNQNAKLTFTTD